MTTTKPFKKQLVAHTDNPWVSVMVTGYENVSETDVLSFRADGIKELRALGAAHTLMKLASGSEYLIRLPHIALMNRLDQPDGNHIDLSDLTVVEGKDGLIRQLKEDFRRAKERKEEPEIADVIIKAFVRASQKSDFKPFEFSGKDLQMSKLREGSSVHGGPTINLELYPPAQSPFGTSEVIIEGKLEDFRRMCHEAVTRGDNYVDMSEYSMRKFENISPREARQRHEAKKP